MNYDMRTPCDACPFLKTYRRAFSVQKLEGFASGEFPCHKTAEVDESDDGPETFKAKADSQHCAGALIYLEKRKRPHQMMRICERLGVYDYTKLDMTVEVR